MVTYGRKPVFFETMKSDPLNKVQGVAINALKLDNESMTWIDKRKIL